eukprot:c25570_g1_i1.p1 GENE.c25570_g1_i1~~c25570_g1_i1.p1  ORF type:complete len:705 (+),score=156.36 c25570_g1_i1:52-2115(+)
MCSKFLAILCSVSTVTALNPISKDSSSFTTTNLSENVNLLVALRVSDSLREFLRLPIGPTTQAIEAFRVGFLEPGATNEEKIRKILYLQIEASDDSTQMLYLGFEDGMFIGYLNNGDGNNIFTYLPNENSPCLDANIPRNCRSYFDTDNTGTPTIRTRTRGDYDPRTRVWYSTAKSTLESHWSAVYVFATTETLGITFSSPIFGPANSTNDDNNSSTFIGAVGVDYDLIAIEAFLIKEYGSKNGVVFIVDAANDKMIAASVPNASIVMVNGQPQQLPAVNSTNQLIAATYKRILETQPSEQSSFSLITSDHAIQVVLFVDSFGLFWRIVTIRGAMIDPSASIQPNSFGTKVIFTTFAIGATSTVVASAFFSTTYRRQNKQSEQTELPGWWPKPLAVSFIFILVGSFLCYLAALSYLYGDYSNNQGAHNSSTLISCAVRGWLFSLGLAVTMSGLLVKAVAFRSVQPSKRGEFPAISTFKLGAIGLFPVLVMVALQVVISRIDPYTPKDFFYENDSGVMHSIVCDTVTRNPAIGVFCVLLWIPLLALAALLSRKSYECSVVTTKARRLTLLVNHSLAIVVLLFAVSALSISASALLIVRAILLFWFALSVQLFVLIDLLLDRTPVSRPQVANTVSRHSSKPTSHSRQSAKAHVLFPVERPSIYTLPETELHLDYQPNSSDYVAEEFLVI